MPVEIGSGSGQYAAVVDHVDNGEFGNQVVLRRPSINLENRTEALKTFAELEEIRLNDVSALADSNAVRIQAIENDTTPADFNTHKVDDTRHTVYASSAEVITGTETEKVLAPATYQAATQEWVARIYDAIVGDLNISGVTHSTLQGAIASSVEGWRILVTESEAVDSTININLDNIEVDFRRGVTFSLGSATTAFNISGNDFYLNKARFTGFTTAAININAAANRTVLRDTRYSSNTVDVVDGGVATSRLGEIIE